MTIVQDSGVCRFFIGLWVMFATTWKDSGLYHVLHSCGDRISSVVRGSSICRFVWREGTLPKSWPQSFAEYSSCPLPVAVWCGEKSLGWERLLPGSVLYGRSFLRVYGALYGGHADGTPQHLE